MLVITGWILGATFVSVPPDFHLLFAKYSIDASLLVLARESLVGRASSP